MFAFETTYHYYVMNKVNGVWEKVSSDFPDVRQAAEELKRLRQDYPLARLGGTLRDDH